MGLSAGLLPWDEAPDYRFFDLRGSHAQLGYALGEADPPFRMQFWWWPPPAARFADACYDVLRDIHPHLVDELHAYADAQRLPVRELWRKCCRVNLKARLSPRQAVGRELAEGCSTFVWYVSTPAPDGEAGHRVVVGRNYDYLPQQARRQRIRFAPDCCAHPSIGARGSVPCGRYDGMNRHGLFAALHVVMTETPAEDEVKPGVPFHLVLRIALELCRTAREARDLLMRIPHLSSLNYLLADARDAFVIEADPRRVRVIEHDLASGAQDVCAATNHFRHPDMRPLQGNRAFANSECRLAFLQNQVNLQARRADLRLADLSVDALLDYAGAIMADRSAPMCGLTGSLTTLWSCVAELTTKRIRYAAGPPCFTPYTEMPAFSSSP
ncbi:MAG: hypothetical protein D6709_03245 [Chloroflexi bacterium]|jgi:hypothetical protein|uniref:Peptidase C45 hydrolase domain-containing protein n=1 Tax=Candidatus Thermofonsia Clade 3 bacterium TaxID=2364212 RepID=A0A2M8QA26_9CHLR|nr:C45 family peptidase [Candidatus Roseilinea sp. NK_OTU-006]PJF46649.1 MAG: hypothetical protein CUN48_12730 [Candidatus Thermofonsia Clade 3 bacterium]RMG65241.1 MAG: hypothetical protein D6709_03245 [Chloroflexota bacterium]